MLSIKFKPVSADHSHDIQHLLMSELGCKWGDGGTDKRHTTEPYLFVKDDVLFTSTDPEVYKVFGAPESCIQHLFENYIR